MFELDDIPIKTVQAASQQGTVGMQLSAHLRQLLVMINGQRTVAQLLALGIKGVTLDSFAELCQHGSIQNPQSTSTTLPFLASSKRGFSELRFEVIDLFLDVGTRDLAVNPWVDKMENTRSIDELLRAVGDFFNTPTGKKHPELYEKLRKVFA